MSSSTANIPSIGLTSEINVAVTSAPTAATLSTR